MRLVGRDFAAFLGRLLGLGFGREAARFGRRGAFERGVGRRDGFAFFPEAAFFFIGAGFDGVLGLVLTEARCAAGRAGSGSAATTPVAGACGRRSGGSV